MSTSTIALPREFRRLSGPGAAILGGVTVLAGSAVVAVFCAQVVYHQVPRTLNAVLRESGVATSPPEWVAPLLVDLSAVSPLLCTFVALCIVVGAARLLFRPEGVSSLGHFPFPGAYRGFFTMFGLIGTLVGFTIAFSPLDAATIEQDPFAQSQMLLAGLATALYSTLAAIVLAYGVCPPIEAMFRGLRRMRTGKRTADMPTALECLTSQAERTATTLAELEASASQAASRLDMHALTSQMGQLQVTMESTAARLAEVSKRAELDRNTMTETFASVMVRLEAMNDRVSRISDAVQRTKESSEAFEERFDGFFDALRRILR